ncbi:2'-5' RNA ligase family protein [Gymnodinialimonas sp. 2305UL16-5]|uniref:2'-5' RNA ligase family protein n=1 Tax=Gymnodinialimonas mytili TaxID=3126503 RepID=UPI0030A3B060
MIRSFLALPIPGDTVDALTALQASIPFGRPVPEDNLHLTLAFLGQVDVDVLEALNDMLTNAHLPAPDIAFDNLDTFAEMEQGLVFASVTR